MVLEQGVSRAFPEVTRNSKPSEGLQLGTLIAGYRLVRLLGKGGEGYVYEASSIRRGEIGRMVAIKVARTPLGRNNKIEPNVLEEARLLMGVRHPGVVRVFTAGHVNGWDYSVMERIDGISLFRLLKKKGSLPLSVCVDVAIQLCDALIYLHGQHVSRPKQALLHRDLKPGNVMVNIFGRVNLIDFGIACPLDNLHQQVTPIYGTPAYMAPEQILRGDMGPETDVFGVGAILYEMATGSRLFPEKNIPVLLKQRAQLRQGLQPTPVTWLSHTSGHPLLNRIIGRCTQPNGTHRYASALGLKRALVMFRRHCLSGPTLGAYMTQECTALRA
jgi:serine/threonine protein kinase